MMTGAGLIPIFESSSRRLAQSLNTRPTGRCLCFISTVRLMEMTRLTHAHWIWMAGLLVVWRVVQDYVNSPRIMGDNLDLRPLTVVFALMVGGQVGGIAGLYLAVPTVAVLRVLWLECYSSRNSSPAVADQPLVLAEE